MNDSRLDNLNEWLYTRRLKKWFRKKGGSNTLINSVLDTEEGRKQYITESIIEKARQLAPHAAKKIGIDEDALLSHLPKITYISSPQVNATIHTYNSETFEMGIYLGLLIFLHKFSALYGSRIGVMDERGYPVEDPDIPFDKTLALLKELMMAFWEGKIEETTTFDIWDFTEKQLSFLTRITEDAERFIIAHEYGHVITRLKREKTAEITEGISFIQYTLEKVPDMSRLERERLALEWGKEIACDILGLDLCLGALNNEKERMWTIGAAIWVLSVFQMLEAFYEVVWDKPSPTSDHPPGSWRVSSLYSIAAQSNYMSDTSLLEPCEAILGFTENVIRGCQKSTKLSRYEAAIRELKNFGDPNLPKFTSWVWAQKGLTCWRNGEHKKALDYFDKSIKINAKFTTALVNKAAVLLQIKEYRKAVECADKALEANATIKNAWAVKGEALGKLLDFSRAIQCYDKVLEIDPYNERVKLLRQYLKSLV